METGRKSWSVPVCLNPKKRGFFRAVIVLTLLFITIFGIYDITSNADLWLKIPRDNDINVVRLEINEDIVFDKIDNVRESRIVSVNPSNGKNKLIIYFVKNESGEIEQRSCIFNRSAHSCLMEVFLSEKNFSCSDCDHIK